MMSAVRIGSVSRAASLSRAEGPTRVILFCQACGCVARIRIMVGHEARLAFVQPYPGQARAGAQACRAHARLPVAGLRLRGDASRAEGTDAREPVLALLSRARARVQSFLQLFRRHERRCV